MYGALSTLGACGTAAGVGGAAVIAKPIVDAINRFINWIKSLIDKGAEFVQQVIAFVQDTLNSFGLGGLVAPVTSWLTSTIQGLREWLKRTGAVGSMLLALFAGMLILRVRA